MKPIFNCHPIINIFQMVTGTHFWSPYVRQPKPFFRSHMSTFFLYWQLNFQLPSITKCRVRWEVSKDILHALFFHRWLIFFSIVQTIWARRIFFPVIRLKTTFDHTTKKLSGSPKIFGQTEKCGRHFRSPKLAIENWWPIFSKNV